MIAEPPPTRGRLSRRGVRVAPQVGASPSSQETDASFSYSLDSNPLVLRVRVQCIEKRYRLLPAPSVGRKVKNLNGDGDYRAPHQRTASVLRLPQTLSARLSDNEAGVLGPQRSTKPNSVNSRRSSSSASLYGPRDPCEFNMKTAPDREAHRQVMKAGALHFPTTRSSALTADTLHPSRSTSGRFL